MTTEGLDRQFIRFGVLGLLLHEFRDVWGGYGSLAAVAVALLCAIVAEWYNDVVREAIEEQKRGD